MTLLRRMVYVGFGALLALGLVLGGAVVFAQSDDEPETPAVQDDGDEETEDLSPGRGVWGFPGGRTGLFGDEAELLAEALGITVEELQAAHEEVRATLIEQAVEEGLITEEQAEQLLESGRVFGLRRDLLALESDKEELLADALDITVEELREAQREVRADRLQELVEAGVLTQEQADRLAARQAVQDYLDREALQSAIQDTFADAIDAALSDGAITQEEADRLLENLPEFGPFGFGGHGPGHHGRGFHHFPGSGDDVSLPGFGASTLDSAFDA
ncbi:MAG: hypothetical protein ACOC9X_03030 [bacterium]